VITEDEVQAMKGLTQGLWTQGDYDEFAKLTWGAAPALIEACGVGPGTKVLDVGAGNGNVAVCAARAGASVVASDLTPAQVARGSARTQAEKLDVEWIEADAEDLPFTDGRFDRVFTAFSAMYAPRPERVASELCRVVRDGGVVGMANWTPEGFLGTINSISEKHSPPLFNEAPTAGDWGIPEIAQARFGPHAKRIRTEIKTLVYNFDSVEAFWAFLRKTHGPLIVAHEYLEADVIRAMVAEIDELFVERNRSQDGRFVVDVDYLLIVAEVP
jgi:ubiquinone/menaquinone biosynthesis C-methylase UbiE